MAIPRRSFSANVSILTSGTVLSQGILAASLPITTRLYAPDEFSLLAVYAATLAPMIVVANLRFNVAIPLPQTDQMGAHLVTAAVFSALLFSIVLAGPVLLAPGAIAALIGQPEIKNYLWMLPLGVFTAGLYSALQYWASRKKQFVKVAQTNIVRAVGGAGTQIGFGVFATGPMGLLLGQLFYGGLGVGRLGREYWRHEREHMRQQRPADVLRTALLYKRFPLYSVPEALFDSAGRQVPVILVAATAGGAEAGMLFLAMRVLAMPVSLIGSSVAQVYLSEASPRYAAGELRNFTRFIILKLFVYGAGPIVGIGVVAPLAFPLVFGAEWSRAGVIATWLTPWFLCQFVVSPVSVALHVANRLATAMWLQFFGFALRVGSVAVAINVIPDRLVEVYAVSSAVFSLTYLAVVLHVLKGLDIKHGVGRNSVG